MRRMRWLLLGAILMGWVGLPTMAGAAVLAPPGHAGANQYFETIPTSSGNAAPPGSVAGSGSSNPGSHALAGLGRGVSTDTRLARQGKTGQAAAALAAATAPVPAPPAARRAATGTGGNGGGSAAGGLTHALTGSDTGGLGLALPLLLATALLAALGLAGSWFTRRAGASRLRG